jgi:hypothetical protein
MIVYSVTITIKSEVEEEWLNWMKSSHIKDVLNTGYFKDYEIQKLLIPEGLPDEVTYLINYTSPDIDSYNKYASTEAPRLQKEHSDKFSGKFKASRAVYKLIE